MASAIIIDGKARAERLRESVRAETSRLSDVVQPGLAVVLVGDNPASAVYVRSKGEQSREAGFHSVTHHLPADTSQAEVENLIGVLNRDPAIHGILVQMPLPRHLDEQAVLNLLDPDKDVDGLTPVSAGRLGERSAGRGSVHATRVPDSAAGSAGLSCRQTRGGARAVGARRTSGRTVAAARRLHRDRRPFPYPRSTGALPRGGHPGRGGGSSGDGPGTTGSSLARR